MPEEVNRIVTDALADLLLTPAADANENLRHEGIPDHKVKLVGNIMIDTLVENLGKAHQRKTLETLGLKESGFVYVTLHRPSNVDSKNSLAEIMIELKLLSKRMPVVFPMHPRTRKMLCEFGISVAETNGLKILDPIGYHDSLNLTQHARLVLTDSGGLQEESTYFRTPCLTLRPNTERPVTIDIGSNRLTSLPRLGSDIEHALSAPDRPAEHTADVGWPNRPSHAARNNGRLDKLTTNSAAMQHLKNNTPDRLEGEFVPSVQEATLKLLDYCRSNDWAGLRPL